MLVKDTPCDDKIFTYVEHVRYYQMTKKIWVHVKSIPSTSGLK